jgi:hypothetical protein
MPSITFWAPATERARLEMSLRRFLKKHNEVVLDFTGMLSATQSFDELLGVLILKHGPDLTQRLVFKGCPEGVREIIRLSCPQEPKTT